MDNNSTNRFCDRCGSVLKNDIDKEKDIFDYCDLCHFTKIITDEGSKR